MAPQAQAPQQAPVAKENPVIAKLQALMTQALEEGDFDKYDQLEARLNKLQPQTNEVAVEQPVVDEDPMAGADEMEC